jgi:hypothetical protein
MPRLPKSAPNYKPYPRNRNAYNERAAAYPSSAWAFGPAVLENRTLAALEALAERIQSGEDCEALRADLMSLRWEIGQMLLGLRVDYDREVEVRDAKHYGRSGGVE